MKKIFNYIGYCICSFIPLYLFLLGYTFIVNDVHGLIAVILLCILAIGQLISFTCKKSNSVFICSYKEVKRVEGIDYVYLILMIIITFTLVLTVIIYIEKIVVIIVLFLFLYTMRIRFKSYTLLLLGYKIYLIRNKLVYSKKSEEQLILMLKEKKSLQVNEVTDSVFIENECYNVKNIYCNN